MSSVFDSFTSLLNSTSFFGEEKGDGGADLTDKKKKAAHREEARKRLYQGIEVRNRRYRFKEYKRCFVASEAVDFMVQSGWAPSREDAVELGQALQDKYNLFEHVVEPGRHQFCDKYLFFKFNEVDDPQYNTSSGGEQGGRDSLSSSLRSTASNGKSPSSRMTDSLLSDTKKTGLISVGHLLKRNMNVKYNKKLDAEGFYAEEAVDYMVSVGLASSRNDAVTIGMALQGASGFIQPCRNRLEPFQDTRIFFHFNTTDDILSSSSISKWRKDLQEARDFFRENIKLVDHTYRLKTYKNTFTGKEAVDLFLIAGITSSRQDAVLLGRVLMVEYNLFGHVVNEHEFEDSEFFYILGKQSAH